MFIFCDSVHVFIVFISALVILVFCLCSYFFTGLVLVRLLVLSLCPVSLLHCVLMLMFSFFSMSHVSSDTFNVLAWRIFVLSFC